MEYDHQHKHYAIYTAEREEHEQDDPTDTWHHAFLMLVDETDGTPTILQQLHFVDGENDMLTPNVREGISDPEEFPDRFKGVKVFKEEEGDEAEMLHLWNHFLRTALYLQVQDWQMDEDGYKHDPETLNCRTAVMATLLSGGLDKAPETFVEEAGTRTHIYTLTEKFADMLEEGERPDLDQLRRSNINLSATMAQEWTEPNRYIGPLPEGYLIYLNHPRGQSPATPEANELG